MMPLVIYGHVTVSDCLFCQQGCSSHKSAQMFLHPDQFWATKPPVAIFVSSQWCLDGLHVPISTSRNQYFVPTKNDQNDRTDKIHLWTANIVDRCWTNFRWLPTYESHACRHHFQIRSKSFLILAKPARWQSPFNECDPQFQCQILCCPT